MTYSLLTVHRTNPDGTVDGSWLQDHIGTPQTAREAADRTSAMNSGMDIAVVPGVPFCGPGEVFANQHRIA